MLSRGPNRETGHAREMRLPDSAHTARPWRIHELTRDFRLEDVWALPTPGGPDDFPLLVRLFAAFDTARSSSAVVQALFAICWKMGSLLGLDRAATGLGSRVPSLRERLPDDLRHSPRAPLAAGSPFRELYLTGDEWALEIANRTVHGVLHLGWVQHADGLCRGQPADAARHRARVDARHACGRYARYTTPFSYERQSESDSFVGAASSGNSRGPAPRVSG
jgi:hypothetical protein